MDTDRLCELALNQAKYLIQLTKAVEECDKDMFIKAFLEVNSLR